MSDKPLDDRKLDDEGWSEAGDDELPEELPRAAQPAATSIRIERFKDGVTIEIPPAGLWKGRAACSVWPCFGTGSWG